MKLPTSTPESILYGHDASQSSDGISLRSAQHPRASLLRRAWGWLRRPKLSPDSLETIEIDIYREDAQERFGNVLNGLLDSARMRAHYNQKWANIYGQRTDMNDNEIEKEIQAKGLTAPRVTLAHIASCIAYELYVTGDQLVDITTPVLGIAQAQVPTLVDTTSLSCLTLCVLVLKNGFTVTGESACVSPENFDSELGRKVARQNAVSKVWMLEGYALKERLYASG